MLSIGKITIIFIAFLTLASCSNRPPDCSDPNTYEILRNIIIDQLGQNNPAAKLSDSERAEILVITQSRATGYDKEIKKFSCQAHLSIPWLDEGQHSYEMNLSYASQLNDSSEHIAVLHGLTQYDLIGIDTSITANIKSGKESKNNAKPETAAAQPEQISESSGEPSYDPSASVKADDYEQPQNEAVSPTQAAPQTVQSLQTKKVIPPSFDCAKAGTDAERLICATPELSESDANLAVAYKAAVEATADKATLKQQQVQWRKSIRDTCTNTECMLAAYNTRISELQSAK